MLAAPVLAVTVDEDASLLLGLMLCLPLNIASSRLPLRMHSVSRDVVKA